MDPSRDPNTALWLSTLRYKSYGTARRHLPRGQDISVHGENGITALHVAAEIGSLKKAKKLLADKANLAATNAQGETPLLVAQSYMHDDVVAYLMEQELLLHALAMHLGKPPTPNQIHAAMFLPKMQTLRDDVRQRIDVGGPKLLEAARIGDLEAVRELVENGGVHIDSVDEMTGETPVSAALAHNHRAVCDYLLDKRAHAYGPCVFGKKTQSMLLIAVRGGDVDFVRRLLIRGTRAVTPVHDTGTCVLIEAMVHGSSEMVEVILKAGAQFWWSPDVPKQVLAALRSSMVYQRFWARLAIACWRQDMDRVQELMATYEGIDCRELIRKRAAPALFLAVYQQNKAIVEELLARGASMNQPVCEGVTAMTAVTAAVEVDSVSMLQFLLDHGGATSIGDKSLLSIAVDAGAAKCTQMLRELETRATVN